MQRNGIRLPKAVETPRVYPADRSHMGHQQPAVGTDAPKLNADQGWLLRILFDKQRVVIRIGEHVVALRVERTHDDYCKIAIDIPKAARVEWTPDGIARLVEDARCATTESRPTPAPSAAATDGTGLASTPAPTTEAEDVTIATGKASAPSAPAKA